MPLIPQTINNRQVLYINSDLTDLWNLQLKNWVLFLIEDNPDNAVLWPLANLCIEKDLLYMAAVGKAGSDVDDLFDMAMVMRKEKGERLPAWYISEEDVLMTTWHSDFNEGFWFITNVANYENHTIDKVLVINLTKEDYLPKVAKLSADINDGWLPPD